MPKLASEIRNSYYHPDGLTGLDCTVVADWDIIAKKTGIAESGDRSKMLKGLIVNAHALRNRPVIVDIDWTNGSFSNKKVTEDELRTVIGRYFQMYWPFAGAAITPQPSDSIKAESRLGGGYILESTVGRKKLVTEVGEDRTPVRIIIDSPVLKGTITPSFSPSPQAVPGDLRRMTALDVAQQIGTQVFNLQMTMDYQTINGFHVPRHVAFAIEGALSMNLEFAACRQIAD